MRISITSLLALFMLVCQTGFSQNAQSVVVDLTQSINLATPSVTLSWPNPAPSTFVLFRREKDSPNWFILLEETASTTSSFIDLDVEVGLTYEYGIQRERNNVYSFGYLLVPVEAPVVDDRGAISVFVETALAAPLSLELDRLRNDLVGDGWTVLWHLVPANGTVASVKAQIVTDFQQNSTSAVLLFGDIPVPYSGNTEWDGHSDHQGAWPADSYYGDVNSASWTDASVNTLTNPVQPARPQNSNVPGDGKFDQDYVPTVSELAVGRVDFSNLTQANFGISQLELYRRYLNKNHDWRSKLYTVNNKVLVDDNFGYFGGEAFAANGYRNGNPLVGSANVVDGDFFNDTDDQSFLFAYGTGPGSYTSAGGVGTSAQFGTDTVNAVFTQLFGSYHGDWDYAPNPFMVSALASKGGVLTSGWAGRPHWFTHHLGGGETMGYSALLTQNSCDNPGYFGTLGACGTHVSLLGDPTVRAQIVAPVANVTAAVSCAQIALAWSASPQQNVLGYHVYHSSSPDGNFQRLTTNLLTSLAFTHMSPLSGDNYYLVKAVVREVTPSGIFFNTSTGIITNATYSLNPPPVADLGPDQVLTCTQSSITISWDSLPYLCSLSSSTGTVYTPPAVINQPGVYTLTVTDPTSGCTATDMMTVTQDIIAPQGPTATIGTVNCAAQTVQLLGSGNAGGNTFQWTGPNNFTSIQQNPVVSQAGTYVLTVTTTANGCTASASVTVQSVGNPNATATGGNLTCLATSVQLMGNSTTPNVAYSWTGPNGFTSNQQNPTTAVVGNYLLTVTSQHGCTATASASVSQTVGLPVANPTPSGILTCTLPQVTIQANPNQAGYNFAWTGPNGFVSTAQNALVTAAGSYTVLVTNPASGCSATFMATVNAVVPPTINFNLPDQQLNCNQPTVAVDVTDICTLPGLACTLNGQPFTGLVDIDQPGDYEVVATHLASGCTTLEEFSVTQDLQVPNASVSGDFLLDCTGMVATLHGSSTTPGVNYSWEGPGGFVSNQQNTITSVAGTYQLTVTAPNGCTATGSATVTQSGDFPVAMPMPTGILTCLIGQVTILANPSQAGFNFSWSGPNGFVSNDQDPVVSVAGQYLLQVQNPSTGCVASYSTAVMMFVPPIISIELPSSQLSCDAPSIIINLTAICGSPGYTCTLNGQPIGNQVTIDQPGNYLLVATHTLSGCTASDDFDVVQNSVPPNLTVSGDISLDCATDVTTLTANSTTPGVLFTWAGLNGNQSQTVPPGNYTVTATAPNGCTATQMVSVTSPPPFSLFIILMMNCNGESTPIVDVAGGTEPYTFEYLPEPPYHPNTNYQLTVTDANGCTAIADGNTGPASPPVLLTIVHTDETVLGANNGTATAQPAGGMPPYVFSWSNGMTAQTVTNLAPGTYTATVTDANGCQAETTVTIQAGTSSTQDLPGLRSLRLSPNPTGGRIELALELDNPSLVQVELMDVAGRILTQTTAEIVLEKTWQFDLGTAVAGIYFCKITVDGQVGVLRVAKID